MCSRPTTGSPAARVSGQAERAALEELIERVRSAELQALHLERALASNRRIGMAVGLLMCRYRLSPDQGIDFLRRVSQERNVKVRELAEGIIGSAGREHAGADRPVRPVRPVRPGQ